MRTKIVAVLPPCQACGEHKEEMFDVPTVYQCWTILCRTCRHGQQADIAEIVGVRLVLGEVSEKRTLPGIEVSDVEDVIMRNIDRLIGCTVCMRQHTVAPVFIGTIECRCGHSIQVSPILEAI